MIYIFVKTHYAWKTLEVSCMETQDGMTKQELFDVSV